MDLVKALAVSASGMSSQGVRLRVVAENLANANSTAEVPGGEPYRRKLVSFKTVLDREAGVETVSVDRVGRDQSAFDTRFDPGHPSADPDGYVQLPNVKPMVELVDLREAQRTYEANLNALTAARTMLMRTIDLLRG